MPNDINSAEVLIERQSAWVSRAVSWVVLLDGRNAGTVSNGSSLGVRSAPGRHTIVVGPSSALIGPRSEPFPFDAEAGERIDIMCQATMWRPKIWQPGMQQSSPVRSEPTGTASRPPMATTATVIEGSRYEVPLGDETRTIDNSKSASSTTRVVRVTREWTRTCTVDIEHATTVHGSAGLGIQVLDLKVEAERTLSKTYSSTAEERETFEEEVTLNIAQHTRSKIVFSWKEIRQKGSVQIAGERFEARIPYEIVVGLTFDQQQIDAP